MEDNLAKRFWKKVIIDTSDKCWIWTGATQKGYGAIKRNGKVVRAHRVSYELAYGSINNNLLVIHSCDNRRCVNPAHLRQGTYGDNNLDMVRRDRCNSYHAKKTHCPQGHEYNIENTYIWKDGAGLQRRCKMCESIRNKNRLGGKP